LFGTTRCGAGAKTGPGRSRLAGVGAVVAVLGAAGTLGLLAEEGGGASLV
jgi:hypothetical protein